MPDRLKSWYETCQVCVYGTEVVFWEVLKLCYTVCNTVWNNVCNTVCNTVCDEHRQISSSALMCALLRIPGCLLATMKSATNY